MRSVGVIGLGLIGGSLARRLAGTVDLRCYDADPATRAAATAAGLEVAADPADAVADRDLVVLAVPLPALPAVLPVVVSTLDESATLTDVTSVKRPVLDAVTVAAQGAGRTVRYVGGHPMAGTERSGFAAADPALFTGAAWALGVEPDTDLAAWLDLAALLVGLGCRVVPAPAAEHDAALARVSALPHVLACALATAGAAGGPLSLALAAGSYRDGTRVAGSPAGLITAICDGNRAALAAVLDGTIADLAAVRDALRDGGSVRPLAEAGNAAKVAAGTGTMESTLDTTGADLRERLVALGTAGGHVHAVSPDRVTLGCTVPNPTGGVSTGPAAGTQRP